jgi:hypothetical protein
MEVVPPLSYSGRNGAAAWMIRCTSFLAGELLLWGLFSSFVYRDPVICAAVRAYTTMVTFPRAWWPSMWPTALAASLSA